MSLIHFAIPALKTCPNMTLAELSTDAISVFYFFTYIGIDYVQNSMFLLENNNMHNYILVVKVTYKPVSVGHCR